jgi:serine/threonine protein kinase
MLEGKTPFMGKSPTETFRNIVELKGIEFKLCKDEQARDLVTRLLRLVPEERIGAINF